MPKQTNEEKLKEEVKSLKSQLEEAVRVNTSHCETIKILRDKLNNERQTSKRLAIAFIKVRHALSDSMMGLLVEGLNPGVLVDSELVIEERQA